MYVLYCTHILIYMLFNDPEVHFCLMVVRWTSLDFDSKFTEIVPSTFQKHIPTTCSVFGILRGYLIWSVYFNYFQFLIGPKFNWIPLYPTILYSIYFRITIICIYIYMYSFFYPYIYTYILRLWCWTLLLWERLKSKKITKYIGWITPNHLVNM